MSGVVMSRNTKAAIYDGLPLRTCTAELLADLLRPKPSYLSSLALHRRISERLKHISNLELYCNLINVVSMHWYCMCETFLLIMIKQIFVFLILKCPVHSQVWLGNLSPAYFVDYSHLNATLQAR